MTSNNSVRLNNASFVAPNQHSVFKSLSLTFKCIKTGLVGKNGIGKSTILKLISGDLTPSGGKVETKGTIAYCPQLCNTKTGTIADLLGISPKLKALKNIQEGSVNEDDFNILNDDWDIIDRTNRQLANFNLSYLALDQSVIHLSGGEKTRIMLARAFLQNPDFLLLDEPTNNLDIHSREFLYDAIKNWNKGLIVVSHDRTLLRLMNEIIELTSVGAECYGGNYDHFVEQKALRIAARQQDVNDAKRKLSLTKASMQKNHEKSEQKQSKGRTLLPSGRVDKLTANYMKGRSEKTKTKNVRQASGMQKGAEGQLKTAQEKIEISHEIEVDIPKTKVPSSKNVLNIHNLSYKFAGALSPLIDQFNFHIVGPERVAIVGENGCGKTSLINLILGISKPSSGKISIGVQHISYLDQYANQLHDEETLLDNFMRLNPTCNEQEAYYSLAKFIFRNVSALKKAKDLSGGERLRAMLACVLLAENPPQLLILDEPTNHLDIDSINNIESILNQYQGALIVISHDSSFIERIGIKKIIEGPFN